MEPLPNYDPRYPATTNYYWGTIENNMTATSGTGSFKAGSGPPGFDTSVQLYGSGCMSHPGWAHRLDPCAQSPANCDNGISLSMWFRLELGSTDSLFDDAVVAPRRYLLSTGGDDSGSPGIAVYMQGHVLTALLSTGAEYWQVSVTGLVRNNTWENFGLRWNKEAFDDDSAIPGLQLYINAQRRGHTAYPRPSKAPAHAALDPVEVMVGCHRTAKRQDYRDICACEFDELAVWTRPLPGNETVFFLGGYSKFIWPGGREEGDENLVMSNLKDILLRCPTCTQEPEPFKSFINMVVKVVKTVPEPVDPTVASTASAAAAGDSASDDATVELPPDTPTASKEEVNKVKVMVDLIVALTKDAKKNMPPDELGDFMELLTVVGTSMEAKTLGQWRTLEYTEKEEGGASEVVNRFETWALQCAANVVMDSPKRKVYVKKNVDNAEMEMEKMKIFNYRQKPTVNYPIKDSRGLDTIQLTSELFNNPDEPACRFVDVSVMFTKYSTFGMLSPKRASTIELDATDENQLDIDGPVLTMKYQVSGDESQSAAPVADNGTATEPGDGASLLAKCAPSSEKLRRYPLKVVIGHSNTKPALRKPLFHENEINSGILRRVCVWWNPELSDYGSWDADGCKAVESTDFYTKCACAHFGQFAIMLEKVPPKVVDLEYDWLKIIKYVCYCVSALLLIVFIVVVIKIKQLHEMFHLMRLNTAFGLLLGSAFMCLTDIPEVRADRHICTSFAAVIHFFYLLAGTMVLMEGLADFLSVTNGAIGGKLKSYVAFSWGVPFLSLGYAILMYLHDYGTDPRCMLGWPDRVKMTMFLPMIIIMSGSFLMTCLVSCNMQASQLRKENIVAEQLTVCKGFVFFSFYFVATWIVGIIAYLRLGLSVPGFYPLFQVLNSTGGIVFFLFCGVGSERFRLLIAGKAQLRKKMLFSYTVSEQLSESQQNLVEKEPSRPATPEEEQAPFDPNARGPRGPLVA